jgi:hypothetical protein
MAPIGHAQVATEPDLTTIDAAGEACLLPSLPVSGVAFESRVKTQHAWVESGSPARPAAFGAALKAVAVHHDTVFVCGRLPSDCSLRRMRMLISFSEPRITGDTAQVKFSRRDRTEFQRTPVGRKDAELQLVRHNGLWRVVSMHLYAIS